MPERRAAEAHPSPNYVQRGFGLKSEVAPILARDYDSAVVQHLRANENALRVGDVTIRLAKEFGFCYGVERAVDYAYETRTQFPDRRIFLTGEIIHNPHVNGRMAEMGIGFLSGDRAVDGHWDTLRAGDVVLLPAFGVTTGEFERLEKLGVVMVDTTCGSVLNVWKTVQRYARDGFTSLIHGKYWHEETRATASQAEKLGGKYLIVLNMDQGRVVCDFIEKGGDAHAFFTQFADQVSPGFDPTRDLERMGVANQTTMLANESLEIADLFRQAYARKFGESSLPAHFRSFETICSATQERQDAVIELVQSGVDFMVVLGGYNSSNTTHLAAITAKSAPTFHIQTADCIVDAGHIRHKPVGQKAEAESTDWFPKTGPVTVGITAGASTPNNEIGKAVKRLLACRDLTWEPSPSAPSVHASVSQHNPSERKL